LEKKAGGNLGFVPEVDAFFGVVLRVVELTSGGYSGLDSMRFGGGIYGCLFFKENGYENIQICVVGVVVGDDSSGFGVSVRFYIGEFAPLARGIGLGQSSAGLAAERRTP